MQRASREQPAFCWVASPALLKRMGDNLDWPALRGCVGCSPLAGHCRPRPHNCSGSASASGRRRSMAARKPVASPGAGAASCGSRYRASSSAGRAGRAAWPRPGRRRARRTDRRWCRVACRWPFRPAWPAGSHRQAGREADLATDAGKRRPSTPTSARLAGRHPGPAGLSRRVGGAERGWHIRPAQPGPARRHPGSAPASERPLRSIGPAAALATAASATGQCRGKLPQAELDALLLAPRARTGASAAAVAGRSLADRAARAAGLAHFSGHFRVRRSCLASFRSSGR